MCLALKVERRSEDKQISDMTFPRSFTPELPTPHIRSIAENELIIMYCQKCRTPLKLDSSLESLNPAAFELLVSKCATPPSFVPDLANQASV